MLTAGSTTPTYITRTVVASFERCESERLRRVVQSLALHLHAFATDVELTQEELELAARGSFVTRVIYVENPHTALPIVQPASGEQAWIEAPPGEDPLVVADERGRAVAILRIGSRVPNAQAQAAACTEPPPFVVYDPDATCPPKLLPNQ